ncbi:MAG: hypothetical protein C4295_05125 [Candidatus Fervidibacterota bacterium]
MTGFRWDWSEPPDPKWWQLLSTLAKRELWAIEHGLLAAKVAALTARALTLSDEQVEQLSIAGLLHDVGKIALPAEVLQKPRPLREDEYTQVKRHPSVGARLVGAMHLPSAVLEAIRHHHERVDGRGYPFGKRGDEIPLEGRIGAVSEQISAFLTPRWYRPPLSPARALERLSALSGSSLDPEVAKAALSQLPSLFGVSSLASVALCTQPMPLERLVREEEERLWRTLQSFTHLLAQEMERLMGRKFCQAFFEHLNAWFARQCLPLHFQKLRLVSRARWWQTLGDFVGFAHTLIGTMQSALGHLVGAPFLTKWLDSVRAKLPEWQDAVGLRYGLWVWHREGKIHPMAVCDE